MDGTRTLTLFAPAYLSQRLTFPFWYFSISRLLPILGFWFHRVWSRKKKARFWKIWSRKKSIGFGFEKFWSRKKVAVSVSENLVSEKSVGVGFGQNFGIVIQWLWITVQAYITKDTILHIKCTAFIYPQWHSSVWGEYRGRNGENGTFLPEDSPEYGWITQDYTLGNYSEWKKLLLLIFWHTLKSKLYGPIKRKNV